MPTLHWIGKDKVINHHLDVPFRVLDHQYTYNNGTQTAPSQLERAGGEVSGNKIIHGDNLEALKALLPEYEGKISVFTLTLPTTQATKAGYITTTYQTQNLKNGSGKW